MYVIAPNKEKCPPYLTPHKRYEVVELMPAVSIKYGRMFTIYDDTNYLLYCHEKCCNHAPDGWIINK